MTILQSKRHWLSDDGELSAMEHADDVDGNATTPWIAIPQGQKKMMQMVLLQQWMLKRTEEPARQIPAESSYSSSLNSQLNLETQLESKKIKTISVETRQQ